MRRVIRFASLVVLALALIQSDMPFVLFPGSPPDPSKLAIRIGVYTGVRFLVIAICLVNLVWKRRKFREDIKLVWDYLARNSAPSRPEARPRMWKTITISFAVLSQIPLCIPISEQIGGTNFFRMAHVAANIEKMLTLGIGSAPAIYNKDVARQFFDFPIYQATAALLCRITGLSPVISGRLINLFVAIGSLLLLMTLLETLGLGRRAILAAIFFAALSPLSLFYSHAIIPDPLAQMLSLASLIGYIRYEKERAVNKHYWLMFLCGVLSALIKSPTYFAIAVLIAIHTAWTRGWRGMMRPSFLLFFAALLATVVAFTIVSGSGNVTVLGQSDLQWYFSTLAERSQLRGYLRIGKTLFAKAVNPLAMIVAALGVLSALIRYRKENNRLLLVWLLGCIVATMTFLGVHRHDYYQLIFVAPLAAFAGQGLVLLDSIIRDAIGNGLRGRLAVGVVLAIFALFAPYHEIDTFLQMNQSRLGGRDKTGKWLQEVTSPKDFIVYALDGEGWDPSYLYFAKRDGYNLDCDQSSKSLDEIRERFGPSYSNLYLFVPRALKENCAIRAAVLPSQPARSSAHGELFALSMPGI